MAQMTYDEWIDRYAPVKNHIDENASHEGTMFETHGPEHLHVLDQSKDKVWTLIDDCGDTYIVEGYRLTNRIGHFITEQGFAWPDEKLVIQL